MARVFIDDTEIEVKDGRTILDAAEKAGIEIPTMCFLKGHEASTSCMVCAVRVLGSEKLLPACGTLVWDGMRVESNSEQVRRARQMSLELLLSEHIGDCMGPCQVTCPAKMDIPLMIRQIGAGLLDEAIATVKKDIALPAVLGRICPAPCERACRRGGYDEAVSIRLLKRYAADVDLASEQSYVPKCRPKQDKNVAIVGAGPAGLAAVYYLLQQGYGCTVFDEHLDVLNAEIATIAKLGFEFRGQTKVGEDVSVVELSKEFDAVFLAPGQVTLSEGLWPGLEVGDNGIKIDGRTYATSQAGIFAGGDVVRRRKLAVRSVADGKEAAAAIGQYLSGERVTGIARVFNSRMGRLKEGEMEKFLSGADRAGRVTVGEEGGGFSAAEAKKEAGRCLHCDCRKPQACKLRRYAQEYEAHGMRYKDDRALFEQHLGQGRVVFEPGKCIKCGLCVQITSEVKDELGLTFIGRGFDVRVAVPFGHSIDQALERTAKRCVKACPTGAMSFK